jgi:Soluble NSF attachment protein, SNAP
VKALVAAVEDQDVESFTNTVADYDSISRYANYSTGILYQYHLLFNDQ